MLLCGRLVLVLLLSGAGAVWGCVCPLATVLTQFPSEVPADACCLNFSGSSFSHVRWSVFANRSGLQTLDLSDCNISSIQVESEHVSALQSLYLDRNRLTLLPKQFLSEQPGLKEVNLSTNLLRELPKGFLQRSTGLQSLDLHGNQLDSIPAGILQAPGLLLLELDWDLWECSCLFLEGLDAARESNRSLALQDLLGNLTCSSPLSLSGRSVLSVRLKEACQPAGLTALFIVLPLMILAALLLCWCCGRNKKKKEKPAFSSYKKRNSGHSGLKLHSKQPAPEQSGQILNNQLLLQPTAALLSSTPDIYEEVEIKPESPYCSTRQREGPQEPKGAPMMELDSVSVTEVMRDSADREKAYLTQSTEYYSLVPGMDLEDSDQGEYENIKLSPQP